MMPKKLYRAVVEVLVEADSEAGAMDAVAEMLRPLLEDGYLLDWQYGTNPETGQYGKPVGISPDSAENHFDEFEAG